MTTETQNTPARQATDEPAWLKQELQSVLGLPCTATEQDIVAAATALKIQAERDSDVKAHEREIARLIAESCNALTRSGAEEVLARRNRFATKL